MDLSVSGQDRAVLVTNEYPYYFATVFRTSHYVEVKQSDNGRYIWTLSPNGVIVEGTKPTVEELKQALNLPNNWAVGYSAGKQNTWDYHFKVLPQE